MIDYILKQIISVCEDIRILRKNSIYYIRFAQLGLVFIFCKIILILYNGYKLSNPYTILDGFVIHIGLLCIFIYMIIPIIFVYYLVRVCKEIVKIHSNKFNPIVTNHHLILWDIIYIMIILHMFFNKLITNWITKYLI